MQCRSDIFFVIEEITKSSWTLTSEKYPSQHTDRYGQVFAERWLRWLGLRKDTEEVIHARKSTMSSICIIVSVHERHVWNVDTKLQMKSDVFLFKKKYETEGQLTDSRSMMDLSVNDCE